MIEKRLERFLLRSYFDLGIRFEILEFVYKNPGCKLIDIARGLKRSAPLISYNMLGNKRKRENGFITLRLIEAEIGPNNTRKFILTPSGRNVYRIVSRGRK